MKEHIQKTGVRKYAGDDLIELQAEPLQAIQAFFREYPDCIVNGCEVVASGDKHNVTPGIVSITGTDAEGNTTSKVAQFAGAENVALPIYLVLSNTIAERVYGDGKVKPIAYHYIATATGVHPADGVPFLEITTTGGKRFVDVVKITEKLEKVGNGKDVTVTFAEAAERANVLSGEKLSGLFGKVQKWFAGLKTVAFTGKAADLEEDANNRLVTDIEKTGWADKYTKVQTDQKDTATLQSAKNYTDSSVNTLSGDVYRKAQTYTRTEIEQKIANVVNSAPGTLDTLNELAAALGNDPNFATSITKLIAGKADKAHTHTIANVENLQSELNGKAATSHTHSNYLTAITKAMIEAVLTGAITSHTHNYAATNHSHSNYLTAITKAMVEAVLTGAITSHTHSYAATNHSHSNYLTAITKAMVEAVLTGAITSHTHSYAATNHTHSNYLTAITKAMVEAVLTGAITSHTHNYEPAFSKNTAFNKAFGTTAGTVAQGNHTHPSNILCSGKIAANGNVPFITSGFSISRTAEGVYKITHTIGNTNYGFMGTGYRSSNDVPVWLGMRVCNPYYCEVVCYYGSGGLKDAEFSFLIFK